MICRSVGRASDGILGINRRNLQYVYRKNARSRFPLVDDKVRTKEILAEFGIPAPEILLTIKERRKISSAVDLLVRCGSFVVKPARGFGGSGIKAFRVPAQDAVERAEELRHHMAMILSGMYSFDSLTDQVLVEEFIEEHPALGS